MTTPKLTLEMQLYSTNEIAEAIADIIYIVASRQKIPKEELVARALAMYIGVEKPFPQSEVNAILQRHLLDFLEPK